MQQDYFLSIGIPTWNRYQYLKENIEQLVREIEPIKNVLIEVFVSDNASDDQTQSYCESLVNQYDFFHYHRNATNLGANANFENVIKMSNGQYVWMLGDDDLIVENSLNKIIEDIKAFHEPAIIIGGCLNDVTRKRLYPPFVSQPLLTDQSIIKQYDAIKLAGKISVLVFKRNAIAPILDQAWQIIETLKTPWPHLVWFLLVLNHDAKLLFLPYCTNYFLEKNRYNMLQDGISRTNIMIGEYARLICYLKEQQLINDDFYQILVHSISYHRQGEFLKIVAYASYMNSYQATIQNAWFALRRLPGIYNKFNFILFYFLPVLLPIRLRKILLLAPTYLFPQWQGYRKFINYLKQASTLLLNKGARNTFDKKGL